MSFDGLGIGVTFKGHAKSAQEIVRDLRSFLYAIDTPFFLCKILRFTITKLGKLKCCLKLVPL